MTRRDPFDEERKKHRAKDGPGRARGRGWYWGGYWGAAGNVTGYMGVGNEPGDDGDHMGDQFSGYTESMGDGSASAAGGDGGGGGEA